MIKRETLTQRLMSAFALNYVEAGRLSARIVASPNCARVTSQTSVFMSWRKDDATRMAGHFYWLAKTYERAGDEGRAITFKRVANAIYSAIDQDAGFDFKCLLRVNGAGESVRKEAVEYWLSSGEYTERQVMLLRAGVVAPEFPAVAPAWQG